MCAEKEGLWAGNCCHFCADKKAHARPCRFGEGLDVQEQAWLCAEINNHLEQQSGQPVELLM